MLTDARNRQNFMIASHRYTDWRFSDRPTVVHPHLHSRTDGIPYDANFGPKDETTFGPETVVCRKSGLYYGTGIDEAGRTYTARYVEKRMA